MRERNRRRVARGFLARRPEHLPGRLVEAHACRTRVDDQHLSFGQRRAGEAPLGNFHLEIVANVFRPEDLPGPGVEREQVAFATEGIDGAAIHRRRGVRAAFIQVRIDRALVGMFPLFFAGARVEAINGLGAILVAECIKPTIADGDGREANANR